MDVQFCRLKYFFNFLPMETSLFLAKVLGAYFVVVGLALLVNKKAYKLIIHEAQDDTFLLITGSISLIVGILMVASHNLWVSDWRVIITLTGWVALLKGVVRLFFSDFSKKIIKKVSLTPWYPVALVIVVLLGLWLTYQGFWA